MAANGYSTILILTDEIGSSARAADSVCRTVASHFAYIASAFVESGTGPDAGAYVIKNLGDSLLIRCPMQHFNWALLRKLYDKVLQLGTDIPVRVYVHALREDRIIEGEKVGQKYVEFTHQLQQAPDQQTQLRYASTLSCCVRSASTKKKLPKMLLEMLLAGDLFGPDISIAARVLEVLPDRAGLYLTERVYAYLKQYGGKQPQDLPLNPAPLAFSHLRGVVGPKGLPVHDFTSPIRLYEMPVPLGDQKGGSPLLISQQSCKMLTLFEFLRNTGYDAVTKARDQIADSNRHVNYLRILAVIPGESHLWNLLGGSYYQGEATRPDYFPRMVGLGGYPDESVYGFMRRHWKARLQAIVPRSHRIVRLRDRACVAPIDLDLGEGTSEELLFLLVKVPNPTAEDGHDVLDRMAAVAGVREQPSLQLLWYGVVAGEFDFFAAYRVSGLVEEAGRGDELGELLANRLQEIAKYSIPSRSLMLLSRGGRV